MNSIFNTNARSQLQICSNRLIIENTLLSLLSHDKK